MSDDYPPLDPNKVHDLSKTGIDEAQNFVTCISSMLRHLGRITGRMPEAEGLIIALRDTFGRR